MSFQQWFGKNIERDLDDELRDHIERETAENVARGMTPAEASRQARLAFDGIERSKEECREQWGMRIVKELKQDLRYGFRMLLRSPAFSCVAIVTLALGIGMNAALFSGINALLLRPLPGVHPAQLFHLKRDEPALRSYSFPSDQIPRYQKLSQVFENVAAVFEVDRSNLAVSGNGGGTDPNPVHLQLVSGTYFATLGIHAQMGRALTAEDDRVRGGHPFAVISESYWQRRIGQAPDVLSRKLTLNGTLYTILGVAQSGFTGDRVGRSTDVWFPLAMGPNVMAPGTPISARLIARLSSGVKVAQAQAAVDVLSPQLAAETLAANPRMPEAAVKQIKLRVVLESGARGFSPERAALSQSLIILLILAAITLLIVCANVAGLFLARGSARQREMAVRRALGAARARLARQVLTESLLLSAIATVAGVLFAAWATEAILRFVASGKIGPMGMSVIYLDVHPDLSVLVFSASLGAVTAMLFGLAPALRAGRSPVNSVLSQRGPNANVGRSHAVAGKVLVLAEFTLSVVLVASASWLVVALRELQVQDLGFDRDHLLLAWTSPAQTIQSRAALVTLAAALEQRVSRMPGVSALGIASTGPLNGMEGNYGMSEAYIAVPGQDPRPSLKITRAVVTPGYLAAIGTPLLEGRYITDHDNDTSPPVAIINQTLARFEFGNASAVGKHVGILGTPREIVGVVKDAKYNTARDENMGMVYLPYRQRPQDLVSMCLAARIIGNPTAAIDRLRAELSKAEARLPILKIDSVHDQLDAVLVQDRLIAMLSSFLAGLALLLACLGVFGIVGYTVALRTSEIGIRTALGASRGAILKMFLKEVAGIAIVGIALGVPAALAMKKVIASKLTEPASTDVGPLVATAAVLILVAAVAAFLPIRRAMKIEPMVALRCE